MESYVDLTDAILFAQIAAGMNPLHAVNKTADVNGENKIRTEGTVFCLEHTAGLR